MSYDSITIPASGYVSLKKNGLSLSNIRMASIITYSRIDPPKPFCVYGNSTVAYVYGEPGTVITELKVRFWYWLNSNKALEINSVYISQNNVERKLQFSGITRSRTVVALLLICSQLEAAQPICIAFSNTDVSKSEVLISSNAIGVTGGNEGIITIPRFAGDWGVYRIVFFDKGLSVNAIVWFWVNSNKQKVLKNIGKQFDVDNKRVITTDIKRTAIIIACRSNGALIAPFVTSDSDTWKAKVDRLNGDNVASVYVTFFYFE